LTTPQPAISALYANIVRDARDGKSCKNYTIDRGLHARFVHRAMSNEKLNR
jgi:hypothetical protein